MLESALFILLALVICLVVYIGLTVILTLKNKRKDFQHKVDAINNITEVEKESLSYRGIENSGLLIEVDMADYSSFGRKEIVRSYSLDIENSSLSYISDMGREDIVPVENLIYCNLRIEKK